MANKKKRKPGSPVTSTGTLSPGALRDGLASLQRRRNLQREAFVGFKPLPAAFDEMLAILKSLAATDGLHSEVENLLVEAQKWLIEGVDRILSVDEPHEAEEARKLLELEFLLWDFAATPTSVDEWAALEPWNRQSKFGFGKLRSRQEARQQLDGDKVLAARNYWITHSVASHPEPRSPRRIPTGRWDWSLLSSLCDILEHAKSVASAAVAYVAAVELARPSEFEGLSTAAMDEAWERAHQALHSHMPEPQFEALSQPSPKKQFLPSDRASRGSNASSTER